MSEAIKAELEPMSQLISTEMGSPIGWGMMAQVLAPAMIFDYYVGLASTYAFDEVRPGLLGQVLVASEPVGVVAAITPWNVPLFLAAAKLGPVTRRGLHRCVQAGPRDPVRRVPARRAVRRGRTAQGRRSRSFPPVARSASISSGTRASTRSRSPGRHVAGKKIAAACGENLKRFSLELGGKSAAVLLDDVDLSEALPMLMPNAMMNNGRPASRRPASSPRATVYQRLWTLWSEMVSAMKVGDPLDAEPPRSDRSLPSASATGSRATSRSVRKKGRRSPIGGGRPAGSTRAGTSSPRCSSTSTTACASPRRRSSGRFSR